MRVTNQETFLQKAKEIHSDEEGNPIYSYALFKYKGACEKGIIVCAKHGEFEQTPSKHTNGQGCRTCGIERRANLRRSTLEEFIRKAQAMPEHSKCRYDKVDYQGSDKPVTITCIDHGDFGQIANQHLSGSSCPTCAGNIRKTTDEFVIQASVVHSNKYGYDKVMYINSNTHVTITCPEHGDFQQTPQHHLSGQGCIRCTHTNPYTLETFVEKVKQVHKEVQYDYSASVYNGINEPITIVCLLHGEFTQSAHSHLNGCGCPACGRLRTIAGKTHTTQKFIARAQAIHENRWDYSLTDYKSAKTKVVILCKDHGEFQQTPDYHLSGGICPQCSIRSPYSKAACAWLTKLQEDVRDLQWAFHGGEHKIKESNYRADGYSPSTNTIYEFHGCYWHGCACKDCYAKSDTEKELHLERRRKTQEREDFIKSKGYGLIVVWEHELKN